MTLDTLGWVAAALTLVGSYQVAHKRASGLWLWLGCNIGWGAVGYQSQLYSLATISFLLACGNVYAIKLWSRE